MKVGVIGAGTMGSGIAQVFAQTDGYEVYLCDMAEEMAQKGRNNVVRSLDKRIAKGKITQEEADAILSKITAGPKEICKDASMVIDVVPEDMKIKKQVLTELKEIVPGDCIFATNTSSLSVTEMGASVDRPMIGMHFFNPAPSMKLVEVIKGENTPDELCDLIVDISESLGKTPIRVNEAAGFAVNRILITMINEAICVYEVGVASIEDIDMAMKLGANHPMGPLELGDYIGLDIVLAIMETIYQDTCDSKYRPSPLLRKMVRAGKLGIKTGIGFYDYSEK